MSSDRTRSAILAAAERLYADRGFGDSGPLRAVDDGMGKREENIHDPWPGRLCDQGAQSRAYAGQCGDVCEQRIEDRRTHNRQ